MKSKHILFLILALCISTAKSQTLSSKFGPEMNAEILPIKDYKKYTFKVNNTDENAIGYEAYDDDESIGVKAICAYNGFVYFTDVYHNNIKKVNIATGEMISGIPVGVKNSAVWLRDIAVFNGKVYATGDMGHVYIFTTDLKFIKEITVKEGRSVIINVTDELLQIFLSSYQAKDLSMKNRILQIDRNGKEEIIEVTEPLNVYVNNKDEVQGKIYKKIIKNSIPHFTSNYGTVTLKQDIPVIEPYSARNLNFYPDLIVYFDSKPTVFTLYCYKL